MYRVVLVDDEPVIVEGLKKVIKWADFGCEVIATANAGQSGLKLVEKEKPDILITDIRMPGMDGLSMIAALRSEHPDMEITILTGFPEFDYAQRAIALGCRRYLLKPSKMSELEEAVRAMTMKLDEKGNTGVGSREKSGQADSGEEAAYDTAAGNFIVTNAIAYIEKHFNEKLTLTDVAEQVYVSSWHLSKLLNRQTGQSFSETVNSVRIAKAKEYLKDPSLTIADVAERSGFADLAHFARVFKSVEGVPAGKYRSQLNK